MPSLTLSIADLAATHAVAHALAPFLQAGDALLLDGPLAVGKTAFVQALARALGVTTEVTSPTFAIANVHAGARVGLVHMDAYRLDGAAAFHDLGLERELESAVACVEWGERIARAFPAHLSLRFAFAGDEARTLTLAPHGARWVDAWDAIAAAVRA